MLFHCLPSFLPSSYKVGPVGKKASCAIISGLSIYPTFTLRESQCNDAIWNKPWADWAAGHPGLDWTPWTGKVCSPHPLPARCVRGSRSLWPPFSVILSLRTHAVSWGGKIWLTGSTWVAFKKIVSVLSLWSEELALPYLGSEDGHVWSSISLSIYPLSYQWDFCYWFQKLEIKI